MIAIFDLRSYSPSLDISILSIKIFPLESSTILNKACMMDDLPAPVRPTIPIFSPALMVAELHRQVQ
jgi:hypothetical protein